MIKTQKTIQERANACTGFIICQQSKVVNKVDVVMEMKPLGALDWCAESNQIDTCMEFITSLEEQHRSV